MSLGPPFDSSGEKLQQLLGAALVIIVGASVALVLLRAGQSIGPGTTIHVAIASPGLLKTGARVRLAGREIGEVRGMSLDRDRRVDVEVFLARGHAGKVRKNSSLFVGTPSVLGEAYLEIGPPAGGADPGAPVADGDRLRAVDPPEIDKLLQHTEANLRVILSLLREHRAEFDELLTNGESLLATLAGIPVEKGQLGRVRDQFASAIDSGRALIAVVREAGGVERIKAVARELGAIADQAGPELRALGKKIDLAEARVREFATLFSPERRAQIEHALQVMRRAAATGEAVYASVQALVKYIDAGHGTLGAFLQDNELFDDLHETHRILKSQPWTLILKPQRDAPPPPKKKDK